MSLARSIRTVPILPVHSRAPGVPTEGSEGHDGRHTNNEPSIRGDNPLQKNCRAVKPIALAIVGSGLTHFISPQLIEPATKPLFPNNTPRYVYVNGALETALGLGLWARCSRKVAAVGLIGYAIYIASNAVRHV